MKKFLKQLFCIGMIAALSIPAAFAVTINDSTVIRQFYSTTLEGMAARELYCYGIISATEINGQIQDDAFRLDRMLTWSEASIILSKLTKNPETDIPEEISGEEYIAAWAKEAFRNAYNLLSDDIDLSKPVSSIDFEHSIQKALLLDTNGEGNNDVSQLTRGEAFEMVAEYLSQLPIVDRPTVVRRITAPADIIINATSEAETMEAISDSMQYIPHTITIRGDTDIVDAVKNAYDQNELAIRERTFDTERLNDKFMRYSYNGPGIYMQSTELCLSFSDYTYSEALLLSVDAQGWMQIYEDSSYSTAYRKFMDEKILPLKDSCKTDVELVHKVSKIICDRASYAWNADINNDVSIHTLLGFFESGRIVCDGYAEIFRACMNELGIQCVNVISVDGNHEWNKVFADGNWYNVDVCWADTGCRRNTILISDAATYQLGTHSNPTYAGEYYKASKSYY